MTLHGTRGCRIGAVVTLLLLGSWAWAMPAAAGEDRDQELAFAASYTFICAQTEPYRVHVSARAPARVRQGQSFEVRELTFTLSTGSTSGIDRRVGGTLRRAVHAGGADLVSEGPWRWVADAYTTDPARRLYSVWGPVGETIDFHVGDLIYALRTSFPMHAIAPALCKPPADVAPLISIPIDPPANGQPITDEVYLRATTAGGAVAYERRAFVHHGTGWTAQRGPAGAVQRLAGNATFTAGTSLGQVTIYSSATAPTGAIIGVNDPDAHIELRARSSLPHNSSGARETITGYAIGTIAAQPVTVHWFVRDLDRGDRVSTGS
jgi:hypothetical protein